MNNYTWQQLLNVDSQDIANLIPIKNIQHYRNCLSLFHIQSLSRRPCFRFFFLIVYMKLNELRKFHIILILLLILEFKSPQLIPVQLFHVNVSFKCQRNMLGSSSVTCPFTDFCKKSFTVTASRLWNVLPFITKL